MRRQQEGQGFNARSRPARLRRTLLVLGLAAILLGAIVVLASPASAAAPAPSGGPTYRSYKYIDSTAPACIAPPAAGWQTGPPCPPVYDWQLITGTDITANLNPDLQSQDIPIGFDFDYYDFSYNSVRIHENGMVGFTTLPNGGTDSIHPESIPGPGEPNRYIAGLMTNLEGTGGYVTGDCGGIVQHDVEGTAPERVFIVEFLSMAIYGGGTQCSPTRVSFQVHLFETSNNIMVVIKEGAFIPPPGPPNPPPPPNPQGPPPPPPPPQASSGVLVGIEYDGGTTAGGHGLQYFYQVNGDQTPVDLSTRAILYYRNLKPIAVDIDMSGTPLMEDCDALESTHGCVTGRSLTFQAADSDIGDSISGYCIEEPPQYGTLVPNPPLCSDNDLDGGGPSYATVYYPDDDFCGDPNVAPESFTYRAADTYTGPGGPFHSDPAEVTIPVLCVADAPQASDDLYVLWQNCSPDPQASCGSLFFAADPDCTMSLSGARCNDADTDDGEVPAITPTHLQLSNAEVVSGPANGRLLRFDGTGTHPIISDDGGFRYIPDDNFCGDDIWTYRLLDDGAHGLPVPTYSNIAVVTMSVTCQGAQPDAGFAFGTGSGTKVADAVTMKDITQNSDPNVQIVTWVWTFGDGHTEVQCLGTHANSWCPEGAATAGAGGAVHAYEFAGVFEVCMTLVNDRGGSTTLCRELVVNDRSGQDGSSYGNLRADAGKDITVPEEVEVLLHGGASGGTPTTWSWRQVGTGPKVEMKNPNTRDMSFMSPQLDGATNLKLTFILTVASSTDTSLPDVMHVTITNGNHPPIARVTEYLEVHEGDDVALDGEASQDLDNDDITFQWRNVTKKGPPPLPLPPPTLTDADKAVAKFRVPANSVGSHWVFTLNVTDGRFTDSNSVLVVVVPRVYKGSGFEMAAGDAGVMTFTPKAPGVAFVWDFGDGSPAVGSAGPDPVAHQYGVTGVYTITLTAKDSSGAVRTYPSQAVKVTVPYSEPAPVIEPVTSPWVYVVLGLAGLLLVGGGIAAYAANKRKAPPS